MKITRSTGDHFTLSEKHGYGVKVPAKTLQKWRATLEKYTEVQDEMKALYTTAQQDHYNTLEAPRADQKKT